MASTLQSRWLAAAALAAALAAAAVFGQAPPVRPSYLPRGPVRPPQSGQPAAARPAAPSEPFQLTPQQQAALDQVLRRWEQRSQSVKTLAATFTLFERDDTFNTATTSSGEVKFKAPDQGMYRVFPATGEKQPTEHWVCDGRSIFEFNYGQKKLIERKLPPEMQGQAIADGPLPFLFSQTADKLKRRYWMRLVAAPPGEIRIEAWPRYQGDAANFRQVDVIFKEFNGQLDLYAVQMHLPGGQKRKVYVFPDPDPKLQRAGEVLTINGFFANLDWLTRPKAPWGWEHVVEEIPSSRPQPPPAAPPGNQPGQPPADRTGGIGQPGIRLR